jgi:hypothetical protein
LFLAVLENRVRASRDWDLDAKPFTVREKLNLGFTLKEKEEGRVRIPRLVAQRPPSPVPNF